MLENLTTKTAYRYFAATGLFLVVLTPYLGWNYLNTLEQKAVSIFEQSILTDLDLESTKLQYRSIQNAITASQKTSGDPDSIDYTSSQIEYLQSEANLLNNQIELLAIDAGTLTATKKAMIDHLKLAFTISFIVMLIAMLLASFGLLGWIFNVRIYQERRSELRQGRITDS
jgi:hypothetical protein